VINYTLNKEAARRVQECIDEQEGIIKRIFKNHWKNFWNHNKDNFPAKLQYSIEEAVKKMLGCGSLESGYAAYQCTSCGKVM